MSITHYLLDDLNVDPETKRILVVALEKTRVSLALADDFANGIIANRLIELAKAGERNPTVMPARNRAIARAFVWGLSGRSYKSRPAVAYDGPG